MAPRWLYVCLFAALFDAVLLKPAEEDDAAKPIFDCPNENEYFEKCDIAVCYKYCKHLANPPPCPSIAAGCYSPKCLCKGDYLRNEDGKCVPFQECKEYVKND